MFIMLLTTSRRIWQGLERGRAQEGAGFFGLVSSLCDINQYL